MQSVIISDTSCLVILSKIDKLYILHKLYGSISVTPEVANEYGKGLPDWVVTQKVTNQEIQQLINSSLDLGESSSIALALEMERPLLILDDLKARNFAKSLNLPYTGTLGIILNAKKNGIIESVKDLLNQIQKTDFRIEKKIIQAVEKLANEV